MLLDLRYLYQWNGERKKKEEEEEKSIDHLPTLQYEIIFSSFFAARGRSDHSCERWTFLHSSDIVRRPATKLYISQKISITFVISLENVGKSFNLGMLIKDANTVQLKKQNNTWYETKMKHNKEHKIYATSHHILHPWWLFKIDRVASSHPQNISQWYLISLLFIMNK